MAERGEPDKRGGIGQAETQGVAGAVIGIAGLVGGYFMPLAGYALGLAAIVIGLLARRHGSGRSWVTAVVVGVLSIGLAVVMQIHYASSS